jgi:hypothetical protein
MPLGEEFGFPLFDRPGIDGGADQKQDVQGDP